MRYDITVITKDKAGFSRAAELISAHGTIASQRELVERPFRFPIGQLLVGSYATFVVEIDRAKMVVLHRALNLDEAIIRSLVGHHQEVKQLGRAQGEGEPSTPEPVIEVPQNVEVKDEAPAKAVVVKKPEPKKLVKPATRTTEISEKERLKLLDEQLQKLLKE